MSSVSDNEIAANIQNVALTLSRTTTWVPDGSQTCPGPMPSVQSVKEIMTIVRQLMFPDYFDNADTSERLRRFRIGGNVEALFLSLQKQIEATMNLSEEESACGSIEQRSSEIANAVILALPELRNRLNNDVEAIFNNDPSADNVAVVIYCYPSITAMLHYRFSHLLKKLGVKLLPRIISELAHSQTGIDIHPGATIGDYFSIDHGTGIVIGETCIIGNHVTVYQGVTLGAKNFSYDENNRPVNKPRHPIIEDHVTIYSNATVLGRITVGHDSIIGGNVWLTENVPPYSKILQFKSGNQGFIDGAGI